MTQNHRAHEEEATAAKKTDHVIGKKEIWKRADKAEYMRREYAEQFYQRPVAAQSHQWENAQFH